MTGPKLIIQGDVEVTGNVIVKGGSVITSNIQAPPKPKRSKTSLQAPCKCGHPKQTHFGRCQEVSCYCKKFKKQNFSIYNGQNWASSGNYIPIAKCKRFEMTEAQKRALTLTKTQKDALATIRKKVSEVFYETRKRK